MKPGDLAIVKCKRFPRLDGRIVLLVERIKPVFSSSRGGWKCILDGVLFTVNSGWLKEIK
jgi:hypothetical protein